MESMREAAADYAAKGYRIFPCHWPVFARSAPVRCSCGNTHCKNIGKHPRIADWPNKCSSDVDTVAAWWRQWPYANIGLATGATNHLDVLDEDPKDRGDEHLRDLEATHGTLPNTLVSRTGSGGRHIFFQHVTGLKNNNHGKIAVGLDFRTDGGQVIAPPSLHFSGNRYAWVDPNAEPASPPPWLTEMLRAEFGDDQLRDRVSDDYWEHIARGVHEKERHQALTKVAGILFGGGRITSPYLASALLHGFNKVCCKPAKSDEEINNIINYIANQKLKAQNRGR